MKAEKLNILRRIAIARKIANPKRREPLIVKLQAEYAAIERNERREQQEQPAA